MAKTEELRDGLFSITWIVRNFSSTSPSREVKVDSLQTFLKSCKMTCKFVDSFLLLKLVSVVPPDPSRKVVVKASYRSFKQTMEFAKASKNPFGELLGHVSRTLIMSEELRWNHRMSLVSIF